ncbi:MAG: ATP-binding protein [Paludibacter sp.]|nr:ATP-binding protein [Paludibacter sp.]
MDRLHRDYYFERVEPYINNQLIKVLIGQRRVGKSYLILQIIDEIRLKNPTAKFIYIDKEKYEFDWLKTYNHLVEYVQKEKNKSGLTYLFIDEIQEINEFEKALRSLQNDGNYDIYCTGSNATLLSGELATLLAGRYIQIRIHSLSYTEFLKFHQLEDSNDSLLRYIKYGGMPHLIQLKPEESVYYEYLRNIFDSIVLRDIMARYNLRNLGFLKNLIRFLADNVGSIVSANKISEYLKSQQISIVPKTILEYLRYMENVLFVNRVQRIDIVGKKIFEVGDKFYFEDLGIRHSIKPYNQMDINKVLENLVFHQLQVLNYTIWVGKTGDKEIDFVAEKNGIRMYIQVCYLLTDEKVHEREFGNLLKINDNWPKMVVSMDELASGSFNGIEHWHIRKFLTTFR